MTKDRRLRFEPLESRRMLSVVTLTADADTYTRSGVSAGSDTTLFTRDLNGNGGDYMAYIRFDLNGVDLTGLTNAYFNVQKIGGATIVPDRFNVYGLADLPGNTPQNWGEATQAELGFGAEYSNTGGDNIDFSRVVNLENHGPSIANTVEQVSGSGTSQFMSGVDVMNFLKDRQADDGLATFIVVVDAGQDRELDYGSRENADPDLRPKLILESLPASPATPVTLPRQVEDLDRGLIVLRRATSEAFVSWRMLGTDPTDIAFNLYRSRNGGEPVKLNATPITDSTNFVDTPATGFSSSSANAYFVRPVLNGVEQDPSQSFTLPFFAPVRQYLSVPLQIPANVQMPDWDNPGQFINVSYSSDDATVADLDGDGQYEIIMKWKASNEPGSGSPGFAAPPILDAYKLDGTLLWRIQLGTNIRLIRSFVAYDLNGDGKAEVVLKTAPGTVDGQGNDVLLPGDNATDDYRNPIGQVNTGPEYLTVFEGATGAELTTVPFLPDHQGVTTWGDDYGRRAAGIAISVAYLDGSRPSLVVGRGIYNPASNAFPARNEMTAWNWRNGSLDMLWWFKADVGIDNVNSQFVGQGSHAMSTADVDGDGKDELIYGAMVIDDDGTGLYSTGLGHGDALHVSDMDLLNPGLEIFMPHENTGIGDHKTSPIRDGATGTILASPYLSAGDIAAENWRDIGRGAAFDIDPNYPGYEFWNSYNGDIYDAQGNAIYDKPSFMPINSAVWWNADLSRELLDYTTISEWDYDAATPNRIELVSPSHSGLNNSSALAWNNTSKGNATLSGDILGDWREEVIWRKADNTELQIWSTTIETNERLYTLVHDTQYRVALAWQNNGYNQPPHPSFWLGEGMPAQQQPLIYLAGGKLDGDYNGDNRVDSIDYAVWREAVVTQDLAADGDRSGVVDQGDYHIWRNNYGAIAPQSTPASASSAPPSSTTAAPSPLLAEVPAEQAAIDVDATWPATALTDAREISGLTQTESVAREAAQAAYADDGLLAIYLQQQSRWSTENEANGVDAAVESQESTEEDGESQASLTLAFEQWGAF